MSVIQHHPLWQPQLMAKISISLYVEGFLFIFFLHPSISFFFFACLHLFLVSSHALPHILPLCFLSSYSLHCCSCIYSIFLYCFFLNFRFYCSQLYLLNLVPNSSALIGQCRPKSVMHPQLYYQE